MKWLRDNFWGIFLGGSLFNWVALIIKGLYTGTLGVLQGTEILTFIFLNGTFYAFAIILLAFLAIRFARYLAKTSRRWRDEREDRLAAKIAEKIKAS